MTENPPYPSVAAALSAGLHLAAQALPTLAEASAAMTAGFALTPPAEGAPLFAYWVGDMDIYAAYNEAHALELGRADAGECAGFELDDVSLVAEAELQKEMVEEDGTPAGTLRAVLAEMTGPGWLAGFE